MVSRARSPAIDKTKGKFDLKIKKTSSIVIAVFTIGAVCLADQPELPNPPKGYEWQWCPAIKSAFLKPDGWHFKHVSKQGRNAYFITKENIDDKGKFETGLTVNVITDIPRKSGMPPSQYAVRFVQEAEKSKGKSFKAWRCDGGPFKGVGCRYEDGPSTINTVLIANDKTGTLFLVIFEAPTKEWDEAWRIGEPIIKKLLIDDEI